MPLARLSLANQIESRQPSTVRDSRTVNAFFEKSGDHTAIVKRPGTLALALASLPIPAGTGYGLTSWDGSLVAVTGNNIYTVDSLAGTATSMGAVQGTAVPISFTQTANHNYLVFHNGVDVYVIPKATKLVTKPIAGSTVGSVSVTNGGGTYGTPVAVTISIASPAVVTHASHGLVAGQGVSFTSTGYLPTGITAGITYAVSATGLTAGSYQLTTVGLSPTAINTSGTQNGTQSVSVSPTVTFSGGGASVQATGTALLTNGAVSSIVLSNVGTGYTSAPTLTLSAPVVGTTAVGVGTMVQGQGDSIFSYRYTLPVGSVAITVPGGVYASVPTVTFPATPGSGYTWITPPQGYATISNGAVTGVVITIAGVSSSGGHTVTLTVPIIFSAPTAVTATASAAMSSTITGPYAYGIEYLDGYVFIMTTAGVLYVSNLEDPTVWNAAAYVNANSDPDSAVGLLRHLNYVIAFGQWSTDFFYNAGNTTNSPLAVNKQAKLEFGCANGSSIAKAEQTALWVSNSKTQGRSIYMFNGLTPQKVSTRYIDKYLNRDPLTTCRSYCMKTAGHTLYVITLPDSNITFVYDLDEQTWYQWSSQSGGTETYFKFVYFNGNVEDKAGLFLQHETDGQIYAMSPDYYKDDANDIWFRSVSKNLDSGTNKRKFFIKVEVIGDKILGNLSIRHSDNDFQSWSNYRVVDLSKRRPILYQGGEARRRAYEVFSSDNIPIRLEALEMEFDIGETGGGQEG